MHLSPRELFLRNLAQTSDAPMLLEVVRAEGSWLYGPYGQRWLDLIAGISVSSLGHGHPSVVKAVQEQAATHMHVMVYGEVVQQPQLRLAEALSAVLPPQLDNFYFVNSGSEAVDGAMKLAKRYTGRHAFAAQTDAYHGSSQGPLSLMSNEYFSRKYHPLLPDVQFIRQNDIEALEQLPGNLAAVVLELVQAEKGCFPADPGFVKAVREFCNRTGALMVVDEIQTGMGRTGSMFAFEQFGIIPDVLLLGKALGGGMPMGAFVAPRHIMQVLAVDPVLGHITTFGGHPVICAAAAEAVNITAASLSQFRVQEKEAMFRQLLVHPQIRQITGRGLLLAVHLPDETTCREVIRRCVELGVFTDWFLYAPHALRIAPPLNISMEEISFACSALLKALDEKN